MSNFPPPTWAGKPGNRLKGALGDTRMNSMIRRGMFILALVSLGLTVMAGSAAAQTILGRVLDQVNEEPIGGVIVALLGRDGEQRLRVLSDSVGRFVLAPPEAGEYVLVTERFGYQETRSPLIALSMEGEAPLELMIVPAPIGLEGLEIAVEELAAEELDLMGLSPNSLGNRWINRDDIDAIPIKRDMGVILERRAPAGMRIIRPQNLTPGSDDMGLCVTQQRARTATGQGTCSLVVLDGIPISGVQAMDIDPDAIESIAILSPTEAITFYGGIAGAGAVLVWTRRGR